MMDLGTAYLFGAFMGFCGGVGVTLLTVYFITRRN